MCNVDNTEDFIDTRDLIKAIESLEDDKDCLESEVEERRAELEDMEADDDTDPKDVAEVADALEDAQEALNAWEAHESEELRLLKEFAEEVEDYCVDYKHGETLIRESYFTEYVEEMVKDCYGFPQDIPSFVEIDWEETAENVKVDYSEADFDGVTYYFR